MEKQQTDNELLHEISDQLHQIVGLLAIQGKSEEEQIDILSNLGFDSTRIGLYLGMTSAAVRKRKSRRKY